MSSSGRRILVGIALIGLAFATAGGSLAGWTAFQKFLGAVGLNLLLGEVVARLTKPDLGRAGIREVRTVLRGGMNYHNIVFGKMRVGGVSHFLETSKLLPTNFGTETNDRAHAVVAHAITHQAGIHELGGAWVDEFPILSPWIDFATGDITQEKYEGYLNIRSYTGHIDQVVDPILYNTFPDEWDINATGKGIAYTAYYADMPQEGDSDEAKEKFRETFPRGFPSISREVFGLKCYDPRVIAQNVNDVQTWAFSENPAICAATYLILPKRDGGWGWSPDLIDWDSITAAANICDETIQAYDERFPNIEINIPRYRCGMALSTGDNLSENLAKILDTMAGVFIAPSVTKKAQIHAGAYDVPEHYIDNSWLRGGDESSDSLDAIYMTDIQDLFNTPTVLYTQPIQAYSPKTAAIKEHPIFIAEDGDERIVRELALTGVNNEYRAQYLGYLWARKSRYQRVLKIPCNLKALAVGPWDVVDLNIGDPTLDGEYRVVSVEDDAEGQPTLVLGEENINAYTWLRTDAIANAIEEMEDAVFAPPPTPENLVLEQIGPEQIRLTVDPFSSSLVSRLQYERAFSTVGGHEAPHLLSDIIRQDYGSNITIDEYVLEEMVAISQLVVEIPDFGEDPGLWYKVRAVGVQGTFSEWTDWVFIAPVSKPPIPVIQSISRTHDSNIYIRLQPQATRLIDSYEFERRTGNSASENPGGTYTGDSRDHWFYDPVDFQEANDHLTTTHLWYRFRSVGINRILFSNWTAWHSVDARDSYLALTLSLKHVADGIRLLVPVLTQSATTNQLLTGIRREFERYTGNSVGPDLNTPISTGEFLGAEYIDPADPEDTEWMWYRVRPRGDIGEEGPWTSWVGIPVSRLVPVPTNFQVITAGPNRVISFDPVPKYLWSRMQIERIPGTISGIDGSSPISLATSSDENYTDSSNPNDISGFDLAINNYLFYRIRLLSVFHEEQGGWTAWFGVAISAKTIDIIEGNIQGQTFEGCGNPNTLYPTTADFEAEFGEIPQRGATYIDLCPEGSEPFGTGGAPQITVHYTYQRIVGSSDRWALSSAFGVPSDAAIGPNLGTPRDVAQRISLAAGAIRERENLRRYRNQGSGRYPINTGDQYDSTGEELLIDAFAERIGSRLRAPNNTLIGDVEDGGNRSRLGFDVEGRLEANRTSLTRLGDRTATNIDPVSGRQWAAEAGANVTGAHTSLDTANVNGQNAANIRDGSDRSRLGFDVEGRLILNRSSLTRLGDRTAANIAPTSARHWGIEANSNNTETRVSNDTANVNGQNAFNIRTGSDRARNALNANSRLADRTRETMVGAGNRQSWQFRLLGSEPFMSAVSNTLTVRVHSVNFGGVTVHYDQMTTSMAGNHRHVWLTDPNFEGGVKVLSTSSTIASVFSSSGAYYLGSINLDGSGNGSQFKPNGGGYSLTAEQ